MVCHTVSTAKNKKAYPVNHNNQAHTPETVWDFDISQSPTHTSTTNQTDPITQYLVMRFTFFSGSTLAFLFCGYPTT
jgi:hypothetical protein